MISVLPRPQDRVDKEKVIDAMLNAAERNGAQYATYKTLNKHSREYWEDIYQAAFDLLNPGPQGWQSIDSAPRDGTEIWCYTAEGNQRTCYWEDATSDAPDDMGHDAGWASRCGQTYWGRSFGNPDYFREPTDPPTHWTLLLPPPPNKGTE
jgi:hypothetical protein